MSRTTSVSTEGSQGKPLFSGEKPLAFARHFSKTKSGMVFSSQESFNQLKIEISDKANIGAIAKRNVHFMTGNVHKMIDNVGLTR